MDFGVLSSVNFETLVATISLVWLAFRLYNVFSAPVEDLVKVLGIVVPAAPLISLLEVSASGATLRWQTTDQRNGGLRFGISVNGIQVGDVNHQESAVTISGLLPSTHYTIRVVAINQSEYTAASEAIRIRTKTSLDDESSNCVIGKKLDSTPEISSHTNTSLHVTRPIIAPYRNVSESFTPSAAAPTLKEKSSRSNLTKRGNGARTLPSSHANNKPSPTHNPEEKDNFAKLNADLEELRAELREQERIEEREQGDYEKQLQNLTQERELLRQQASEREEQKQDLTKSVKKLEQSLSSAERKTQQLQKALDDKIRPRLKMEEGMARWQKEILQIEAEFGPLNRKRLDVIEQAKLRAEELKAKQQPDQEKLTDIEEQVKKKGKEVAELLREKKRIEDDTDENPSENRIHGLQAESDNLGRELLSLQTQINEVTKFVSTLTIMHDQMMHGMMNNDRRGSHTNSYRGDFTSAGYEVEQAASVEPPYQYPAPARVNFELPEPRRSQTPLHSRNGNSSTNSARTSSPFVQNRRLSVPMRYQPQSDSRSDFETLTGGALISPSADGLLPSNLLGEDDIDGDMVKSHLRGSPNGLTDSPNSRPASVRSRPLSTNFGAGRTPSDFDIDSLEARGALHGLGGPDSFPSPHSPAASFGSNSPSLMSSPESTFAFKHKRSDPNIGRFDSDQRSIRSANGSFRTGPSPRGFFNFRARGKTTSDDGPQLGSLKVYQSQSVPVDAAEEAPKLTRDLFKQIIGARSGNSRESNTDRLGNSNIMNDLGPIGSPYRTSASRPASTYSTEASSFPKPSHSTSLFGWGASKENLGGRSNSKQSSAIWHGSPWDSRRPSITEGHPGFLALGRPTTEDENAILEAEEGCQPDPIGTKSDKAKINSKATQLNPAARDFTSMFGFGKRTDKSEKGKSKKKKESSVEDLAALNLNEGSGSPPDSRKSRDTGPSSFGDSFEDLADDVEQLPLTPTETPPQPSPRGSLMRRITRKGSSSKFGLSGLKDKKEKSSSGGLFSRKSTNVPEEGDDDSGLGRSVDSISSNSPALNSTPDKRSSAFSLSSLRSRRSKKTNESISEVSMSEAGDEDDSRTSFDGTPL